MQPDIRRRRLKYKGTSQLSQIFKDRELLVERPEGMDFEDYRKTRKIQSKILKMLIKEPNNVTLERLVRPKPLSLSQQTVIIEAREKREYDLGIRTLEKPVLKINWLTKLIIWLRNRFR